MHEGLGSVVEAETEAPVADLRLLVASEPWSQVFLQNLGDLFRRRESAPLQLQSAPADFWSDVFVDRQLPWPRFMQSGVYHILALAMILAGSHFLALQPHVTAAPTFTHADVVYYTPTEYLPPLDTRRPTAAQPRKADPEFSAQPIISLPREADNHSQTIVTAPNVHLKNDVALPNTVAWSDKPRMPIAPAPVVMASEISRMAPRMDRSVIAPPPDVANTSRNTMLAPEPSVVAPPPELVAASNHRIGELNVGHSAVIAPAPQLSLDEQRTVFQGRSALHGHAPQVVAPPPSLGASAGNRSGRGVIALNLHPAVGAPPAPVAGNRRGSFAATPDGHRGASGAPGSSAGASTANGSGATGKSAGNLPSGLYVGKNSNANTVNPNLIAGMRPMHAPRTTQAQGDSKISEPERAVFGDRKIYSMSLNMPNLNSAGGSWIIRFAAIKPESSNGRPASADATPDDLASPVATSKVDPAYPLELMKQNVSGTVILYAVILADGSVGRVRVLRSVDERLDRFASEAIAKWQFQPATKNGSPVAVEATFWIPFRPAKVNSGF
ncbi:MAG: TonB family protein [Candidatus Sulfotelmatobacter sp.]